MDSFVLEATDRIQTNISHPLACSAALDSHHTSLEFLTSLKRETLMPQIIPTAEPFFLPGDPSKPACLLIHGFTGTPKEMRWMGDYLNGQGYTCLGIRLSGHATRPKDMVRSRWTDWTASVEDGYNLLRGVTDRVFLVGLSMGGVLSLLMSTRLDVCGVVAMSTPFELPVKHPAWQIRLLSYFKTYMPKTKEEPGAGWFDKEAFKEHISYPLNPIRSAAELQIMLGRMRSGFAEDQCACLADALAG